MEQRNVLVVADDLGLLTDLRARLGEDYAVTLAPGGAEALARLGERPYDVVLSELGLQGVGGLELLRTVRRLAPGTEVIFICGVGDVEQVIQGLNEGAFTFITRPVDSFQLTLRLRQALAVARASSPPEGSPRAQAAEHAAAGAEGLAAELAQPLRGLGDATAALREAYAGGQPPPADVALATLQTIEQQAGMARRMMAALDGFLAEGGAHAETSLELRAEVEAGLEPLRPELGRAGIGEELAVPEGLVVRANPHLLRRVVAHLARNALEAMAGAPHAGSDTRPTLRLEARREDATVVLDVSDSGPGVPTALRGELFRPFVTGKPGSGGHGLGLYLSRTMLARCGVKLELHATGPAGSTFRLTFPA